MIFHIPWIYLPVRTALAVWNQLARFEIPELAKPSVLMRDRGAVEESIQAMQRAGPSALQVISDFDMTLTRFAHNGKRVPTSHNILDNSLLLNDDCKKRMRALRSTYYPVEIHPSLSVEEKIPLMVEWWTKVHELLVQQKIQRDLLAQAVAESSAMLREGYQGFFERLQEQQVPLVILSAGLGDVVEEVIRQNQVSHPSISIISNYMDFDHRGVLQGFREPLLHTFNKREAALLYAAHFSGLGARPNVLLLGDSLGDLAMADGLDHTHKQLSIGFLNDQVEERKESYVNSFDVVLVEDETMDVPNAILNYITTGK